MKPIHFLAIKDLKSLEQLPLPALFLNVHHCQELQAILHHCTLDQNLILFDATSRLFDGTKPQLDNQEYTYPIHLYMADPVRESYQQLVDIVAQLRHPKTGCPWDLAQTPASLTPYIIEEAYEVVHAIDTGQPAAIQEELGDLLLQVVLQAQIAQESGDFSLVEIASGISEKLIRRHPHVFGELVVNDVAVVRQNWEAIKQQEQGHSLAEKLNHYMATFPALIAAGKIYQKLQTQGTNNLGISINPQTIQAQLDTFLNQPSAENLGRLLFMLVGLGTAHQLDSNLALAAVNAHLVKQLDWQN
ncbi:MazG [Gloeomargarita lithophora Alchichica-D10]|uniref:MazG n=1 Tax=Gloeomargarita lithophora Alchichica-D10 TaxID=1188229 RepID=A0A1J0A9K6_9CYAN|nr:MazG family protein [Gloeomargarita lithophora]APB32624.1 MazG [Gloeomargarita lithophora Alchichica-D10]